MVKRFSVSLESDLLDEFDDYLEARSYGNRSEAIRDLIRDTLVRKVWEEDGEGIGVISLVYDHSRPQLQSRITQIQHRNHDLIISATHVHMNHADCLEVIVLSGEAGAIKRLADELSAVRGVRNCGLSITGIAGTGSHQH